VADRGTLERLVIKAYEKPDFSGSPVGQFQAYVNPNEITLSYEMEWDAAQGAGTTGSRMNFKKMKPGDLSLTFFIVFATSATSSSLSATSDVRMATSTPVLTASPMSSRS